jgi:hypothetical protein
LQYIDGLSSTSRNTGDHHNFPNFILGEQSENFQKKITHLNNFAAVGPFFTNSILIDSTQQEEGNEIIKIIKIPI